MRNRTCEIILFAFLLWLLLGALPAPTVQAQENSICGFLYSSNGFFFLSFSPTKAVALNPTAIEDILALNNLWVEQYARVYDPVYSSNSVVGDFSRIEQVTSCFDPLSTPTATPIATSYGCDSLAEGSPVCGCGVYVPLQTFGGTITGRLGIGYPNAAAEAVQVFWNEGYLQFPGNGVWRYQVDFPSVNDALIFKPKAEYYFILANGQLGAKRTAIDIYGHTGIVRSASQVSKLINQVYVPGWEIVLRSANWGCNNGYKTFVDGACHNVSDQKIFVPESYLVSFWRRVEKPLFATLYTSAGRGVLKPNQIGAGSQVSASPEVPVTLTTLYNKAEYDSQTPQIWSFVKLPQVDPYTQSNYYQIVNMNTGLCLDINAGGTADGTAVIQWYCHNGDNQKWLLLPTYNTYQIRSVSSGKYLTYRNQQSPSLVIWQLLNDNSQTWQLHRQAPGCALRAQGDANCDGKTNLTDLGIWGRTYCIPAAGTACADLSADFDFDGDVDETDHAILLKYYQ